jgi:single-stranded-DNA-specific exonuclease
VHRRWLVNKTNPEFVRYFSKAASISPVFAQVLINRGIKTLDEIDSFLNPSMSQLSDPFDMQGMQIAVDRILSAAKSGERILVHGDYDTDGLSATAIVLKALKALGIDCCSFIPNRIEHGYGFNPSSLKKAKEIGASLIITVDCGITSFEAAALAKKEGIDVIITDHHEPVTNQTSRVANYESRITNRDFLLPDALAVINPKVSDQWSQVMNLSGAGIAFKLAQALCMVSNSRSEVHDFLDLAALGTMADVVPLTGENRVIVKEGLKLIDDGTGLGIQALKQVAGIDGKAAKTGLLLFTLIPRINAAGRISDAGKVLDLLLADSEDKAIEIAQWLDKLNSERQLIEEDVYQEALLMLNNKGVRPVIVLSGEGWNRGVIGIVASKITEKFYRPTFILSVEGSIARGSARSIPSFDVCKALGGCKELLKGFGGHKQAAGLEMESGDIAHFEERMNRIADEMLSESDFIPSLEIDANVDLADIGFDLIREFGTLEPFGFGNPEPFLGSKGLEVLYPKIVKDNHLKMKLRQKNHSLDAIGFDMAAFFEKLGASSTVDAVYAPLVNEWEGRRCLQLSLKALRPSL